MIVKPEKVSVPESTELCKNKTPLWFKMILLLKDCFLKRGKVEPFQQPIGMRTQQSLLQKLSIQIGLRPGHEGERWNLSGSSPGTEKGQ